MPLEGNMKIAIVGEGNVGGALGARLKSAGHQVEFVKKGDSLIDYVGRNDTIIFAVPWKATEELSKSVPDWRGKILIDCTNPIKSDFSGLEVGHTTSGGEMIQQWAKNAKVVKCFNQTGFENMANSEFKSGKPVMFAAGDSSEAVSKVSDLALQMGFETVPLPSLAMSRQLEQLAWLWIFTAFKTPIGREFAFGMLKK